LSSENPTNFEDENADFEKPSEFRRSLFQKLLIIITLSCANTCNFIILGLPFMKTEPHHFSCKGLNGVWSTCTKDFICSNNLSKDYYTADTEDSQYISNWVEQADMLCESKSRIGFLGACFFIGVIMATTICPMGYLSDVFGRKWVFILSMVSEIISCSLMLTTTSLDQLYVAMLIMGMGHPGRFIVAINYSDEFLTKR